MKINRLRKIQELLEEQKSISINDLCKTFEVSKNTIRRDIAEMEKNGINRKVYGGIVLQEQESPKTTNDTAMAVESDKLHKQKIAQILKKNSYLCISFRTLTGSKLKHGSQESTFYYHRNRALRSRE